MWEMLCLQRVVSEHTGGQASWENILQVHLGGKILWLPIRSMEKTIVWWLSEPAMDLTLPLGYLLCTRKWIIKFRAWSMKYFTTKSNHTSHQNRISIAEFEDWNWHDLRLRGWSVKLTSNHSAQRAVWKFPVPTLDRCRVPWWNNQQRTKCLSTFIRLPH